VRYDLPLTVVLVVRTKVVLPLIVMGDIVSREIIPICFIIIIFVNMKVMYVNFEKASEGFMIFLFKTLRVLGIPFAINQNQIFASPSFDSHFSSALIVSRWHV
jgi:hypothetical protein